MRGYYNKPEATAAAIDADGWMHTGDMGLLRADGHLRFMGRYKDMLKIGGENVDPMEVEAYLMRHPAINLAAVVSYPDARLSEVGVAFVRCEPGQTTRRGGRAGVLSRAHRELQGASACVPGGRISDDQLGEDPEGEAARGGAAATGWLA